MGLCVFSLPNSPVMIERMCTLSYYHHRTGSMNHEPLFRVRSWNNGMRCMSYYVLISDPIKVTNVPIFLMVWVTCSHFSKALAELCGYTAASIYYFNEFFVQSLIYLKILWLAQRKKRVGKEIWNKHHFRYYILRWEPKSKCLFISWWCVGILMITCCMTDSICRSKQGYDFSAQIFY